jgi:hypothetical protein
MTAAVATLSSFKRQFDAPTQRGRAATEKYGVDPRNDWTGKIVYGEDILNAVVDLFNWLHNIEVPENESYAESWTKFRSSPNSRSGKEICNLQQKQQDLHSINEDVKLALGQHTNDSSFEVQSTTDENKPQKKLVFTQGHFAGIPYSWVEQFDKSGNQWTKVDRILFINESFKSILDGLNSRLNKRDTVFW